MMRARVAVGLVLLVVAALCLQSTTVEAQRARVGFYAFTCPRAESLVRDAVSSAVSANRRTGAGLIRLLFHDCFVQGCDASILIDGAGSEKTADPNLTVHGYEVIDDAKARVEQACPGVVSCADIVAIAARDSVNLLGGPFYAVETGRKDGTVSLKGNTGSIPSPFNDAQALINSFRAQGLSISQMVALSGSHSVGKAVCATFTPRLYNFSPQFGTDPTIDPAYAQTLKGQCPQGGNPLATVDMDPTSPLTLDNNYYRNLQNNRGLFTSDQTLFTSPLTRGQVLANSNSFLFRANFARAIKAMGLVGVKTTGPVRANCRKV